MFARIVEVTFKTGKAKEFTNRLNNEIVPTLRKQPGFVDEISLVSEQQPDQGVSISFWNAKQDAERYNREQFPRIVESIRSLLETEPEVRTFNVSASTVSKIVAAKAA